MKKRKLTLAISLVLIALVAIGGTLAWLVDKAEPVKNTFTAGDINITLTEESGTTYEMIPGNVLEKNPLVTVKADSEDCWLFVKVEETNNQAASGVQFLTYNVDDEWTPLGDTYPGVYYRAVSASNADQNFYVLEGNDTYKNGIVTVNGKVVKSDLEVVKNTASKQPTITFYAYAIQQLNFADPVAAWAEAQNNANY